jgi:cyclophilin family peptidyl-prolyl cis-trans isomerase
MNIRKRPISQSIFLGNLSGARPSMLVIALLLGVSGAAYTAAPLRAQRPACATCRSSALHLRAHHGGSSRRHVLSTAALASGAAAWPELATAATEGGRAKVTDRVFLDIRVITSYDVEVLEDAAVRGRLTIGLFGDDSPLGSKKFLEFIDGTAGQFKGSSGGPAYSSGSFFKVQPGLVLEGGRINGLKTTEFAGVQEYEYIGRLLPLRPILEANELRHGARGLITRAIFNPGPEFGITLGPAPKLDGPNEVIGQLEGEESARMLALMEGLPFITGKSIEGEGTTANAIFQSQKKLFTSLSKSIGDSRSEDRTGMLLRRVEITKCGRL